MKLSQRRLSLPAAIILVLTLGAGVRAIGTPIAIVGLIGGVMCYFLSAPGAIGFAGFMAGPRLSSLLDMHLAMNAVRLAPVSF